MRPQRGLERRARHDQREAKCGGESEAEPQRATLAVAEAVPLRRQVRAHPGAGVHAIGSPVARPLESGHSGQAGISRVLIGYQ